MTPIVAAGDTLYVPPLIPHSAEALEETDALDAFSPVRQDSGNVEDQCLRSTDDV